MSSALGTDKELDAVQKVHHIYHASIILSETAILPLQMELEGGESKRCLSISVNLEKVHLYRTKSRLIVYI